VDDRIVDQVMEAATGAPAGDELHDAVMRIVEIAEQNPAKTREALWALRGDADALQGLEHGLSLEADRATLALGGAIQLASTELASDRPNLRGRAPELVRWLKGSW
jgi:hypothetical protein